MKLPLFNQNMHTVEYWLDQTPESETWTDVYNITLFRNTEKEVIISGFDIAHTLLHDYAHFRAYSVETYVEWIFEWTRFVRIHTHDLERIYTALYTEYSPLENYDKNSTITNVGSTGANSENPFTTRLYQVSDDTVNNTGDDAFIPQTKTTSEGKTDTNNTMTEHTHGNIGVTKSTDMLRDEVVTRIQYSLIETIVRMFADMELI